MRRILLFILLVATVNIVKAQAPTLPEALNPFPGCAGSSTFIVVSYAGGQATSTLWELSTDGGATWNTITENAQYSIQTQAPGNFRLGNRGAWLYINVITPDMEHYQYRLTLSNASGSSGPSAPATLYVATAPPPSLFSTTRRRVSVRVKLFFLSWQATIVKIRSIGVTSI